MIGTFYLVYFKCINILNKKKDIKMISKAKLNLQRKEVESIA